MELQWSDSLSVGNALMDSDHRNLFGMIGTVDHALRSGNPQILSQAFQRLVVCVGIHFANEERLAQAIDLPFDNHKRLNLYLQQELEYMRSELDAKDGLWSESAVEHFSHSLRNWMAAHLGRDERLLKPVLSAQPYDLRP
ncbi:MAG: hemerythrin domain-containing protein [Gallionella sp.]|nr:hemerythrin domain-containing protein [Gallionella sp.]